MAEGSGVTLTDVSGRRYLDAVAGLWCVNIGYGRTEVADAMGAQARRLAYYHTFSSMSNEPQIRLADRLLGMVPGRMSKVFFANSGSEANDTQVKLVWYYSNLRGKPAEEEDHLAAGRLSRQHGRLGEPDRAADVPPGVRPAASRSVLHTATPYHYRDAAPGTTEEAYAAALADGARRADRA